MTAIAEPALRGELITLRRLDARDALPDHARDTSGRGLSLIEGIPKENAF